MAPSERSPFGVRSWGLAAGLVGFAAFAACTSDDGQRPRASGDAGSDAATLDSAALDVDSDAEVDTSGLPSFALRLTGSGPLEASAASVDVTPTEYEVFRDCGVDGLCPGDPGYAAADEGEQNAELDQGEEFLDCGLDRLCPGDPGYAAPDEGEGDGEFQAIFIGGFQGGFGSPIGGRPMQGVHDPVEARLLYLAQGDARLLVIAFDLVGLMPKYTNMLKRRIESAHGVPRGAVVVAAVHNHEGPDSMGPWSANGVAAWWIEPAMERVLAAVGPLIDSAEPASVRMATATPVSCIDRASGEPKELAECDEPADEQSAAEHDAPLLERDLRDPWVRDMLVSSMRLERAGGDAIATVVNWSAHPESLADKNSLVSSDFPGYTRRRVEDAGGGVGVYWSGAVGGMMTPLGDTAVPRWTEAGSRLPGPELITDVSFERTMSLGYEIGQTALDALAGAPSAQGPVLEVETIDFDVPLPAPQSLLFSLTTYFDESDRMTYVDEEKCGETACLRTQVTRVRLGELDLITVPGELFPEFAVGREAVTVGYPGWPDYEFEAVRGLRAEMQGAVPMIIGLANVELGYMLPQSDFLGPGNTFLGGSAAPSHPNYYEESVSAGATVGDLYCDRMRELLGVSGRCTGGG